jgi:hypothetical protein
MSNMDKTEPLWPLAGPTGPIGGHWNDAGESYSSLTRTRTGIYLSIYLSIYLYLSIWYLAHTYLVPT